MSVVSNQSRTLLNWYGGKFRIRKWVLEHCARYPHTIYVEPFGGGASVLLSKEPVPCEVYNDLDGRLVDFFKVVADPKLFKQFERIVSVLPYSRKLFNDFKRDILTEPSIVKRAAMFYLLVRQGFSGCPVSYGMSRSQQCTQNWLNGIAALGGFHARLQRVQIEHKPAVDVIDSFDTPETLFYLDPPYVLDTRKSLRIYANELSGMDHFILVERLLSMKGSAILSGYEHELYAPLLDGGWSLARRRTSCSAAGRTRGSGLMGVGSAGHQTRTECLYLSPTSRRVRRRTPLQ